MRKESDVKAGRIATTAIAVAAAAVVILPATSRATTFADLALANASASGTAVTVDNVTISDLLNLSTTNGYNIDVQDTSGGTQLFRFPTTAFTSFTPAIGQVVDVTATNSPFGGNNEFSNVGASVSLVNATSTFVPTTVTTAQLNDAFTGTVPADKLFLDETVTLANVTISSTNTTFAVSTTYNASDALGTSVLFIPAATSYSFVAALAGQSIPTGPVNITGFVDYFSTGSEVELYPTAITPVPEPAALGLIAAAGTLMAVKRRGRRA
jgi:hypothetical protein